MARQPRRLLMGLTAIGTAVLVGIGMAPPAQAIVDGTVVPGGWFGDVRPAVNVYAAVGQYIHPVTIEGELKYSGCTVTLVAPDLALTTRHCVDNDGTIWFDMLNKSRDTSQAVTRNVIGYTNSSNNHVSVLKLDRPVTEIAPMAVFDPNVPGLLGKGKLVQVVGWGAITHPGVFSKEPGIASDELRLADMRINSNTKTPDGVANVVSLDSIKGYPTEGDSGGPVISRSATGKPYIIGTFNVFSAVFKATFADRLEVAGDIRTLVG